MEVKITTKMTKITFKKNNKFAGRYESNVMTADGYFCKFIITKDKNGEVHLRVHDGEPGSGYKYTSWAWTGLRTYKDMIEWLNGEYAEYADADPRYATVHSRGYA